jgi:hypothetical protein
MGIQGRKFPFKLDTGQREGRINGGVHGEFK